MGWNEFFVITLLFVAGTNEDSPLDPFNIQCTNRRNRTTKITVSFNYAGMYYSIAVICTGWSINVRVA